jgi:hypothetical protein
MCSHLWPDNSSVRRAVKTIMRYVVELTVSGPEAKTSVPSEPSKTRVETLEIDADSVPQAIEKAKEKFRDFTVTDVNIRFR